MLAFQTVIIITLAYLGVLFLIAYLGDRHQGWERYKPVVYSLGLGVYCTSWAFYGVTGQAAETGWWLTPTYTGAILVYVLAWPLVLKVAKLCRDNNLTSLADFIATRYGRATKLSALVAIVSVVAIVPYISLQLRAITTSFNAIVRDSSLFQQWDITLIFALILSAFAILFGTRRIRTSEHNPGLTLAIAFESIVKLITFLALGIFVCFYLFDGVGSVLTQYQSQFQPVNSNTQYMYLTQTLIGVLMMFCLPRQFHMCFIEHNSTSELRASRWLFPAYMLLLNLFALPIAYAGLLLFQGQDFSPDSFMLQIPIYADNGLMTLLAFIGGFSAATSMVIVASIVLSIMVSNDLVTPWLLKRETLHTAQPRLSPKRLVTVRRITIVLVILAAYFYHHISRDFGLLANTGLMAMALVAQFAPALLFGLIWRRANLQAAYSSIVLGSLLWGYTLLLPTLLLASQPDSTLLNDGLFGWSWLRPTALFGMELDYISHGILMSLGANLLVFLVQSARHQPDVAQQLQAAIYLNEPKTAVLAEKSTAPLSNQSIYDLLTRFEDKHKVDNLYQQCFPVGDVPWQSGASPELEGQAKKLLSGIIGGASAQLVMESAAGSSQLQLDKVVDLVDEASEVYKFNRALLQSTIQNIEQGISVVDKSLRLVAWNRRYIEMFQYPEAEIYVGRPVQEILQFNADRGLFGKDKPQVEIDKRLEHLRSGQSYRFQRVHKDGRVLEMQGNPLPGGGFVTTYSDITEFIENQRALEEINLHLEQRVQQRTKDLQALNQQLRLANQTAEQANIDKTRYFAAISHDLLQPFNAATLFCSILREKADKAEKPELTQLGENIQNSLENAEALLSSVLELTKLDAGAIKPVLQDVDLQQLLQPIAEEYRLLGENKGLQFEAKIPSVGSRTDVQLFKRIVQNLLTNAIRYTQQGEVSLVVTVLDQVQLSVTDTGIGIAQDDLERIFQDFEQVSSVGAQTGLGLGLAITSRICKILGYPLTVDSKPGHGSTFTISLPIVKLDHTRQPSRIEIKAEKRDLGGTCVLVIDNEDNILQALAQRLQAWGCEVLPASGPEQARTQLDSAKIDLIIADYHLDEGKNGVELIQQLQAIADYEVPAIVNSGDHGDDIREIATSAGYDFIAKPVKPATLKRLIKKNLRT